MSLRSRLIMATAMAATISTVMPGFLVGAVAVQAIAEFGVSEARYGWGLGSFFLAAVVGSAILGRAAQVAGPRRLVVAALLVSAVASLGIALLPLGFGGFLALLAIGGLANSANQTAVNLLLTQARIERLGLAIALKQAGMPAASMLSGLMVPLVAVTLGWRVAYGIAAVIAGLTALAVVSVLDRPGPIERAVRPELVTPRRTLRVAAVGFGCLAVGAASLNAWTVLSAVAVGLSVSTAGLLLSGGAGSGVVVRLLIGFRLDTLRREPLRVAAVLTAVGALGLLVVAIGTPAAVVLGTLLAFATGWVWPVLTNFAIVRSNQAAAATATGITQTGVYVGIVIGPLVTGLLIETLGFSAMWIFVAAVMAVGVAIISRVRMQDWTNSNPIV